MSTFRRHLKTLLLFVLQANRARWRLLWLTRYINYLFSLVLYSFTRNYGFRGPLVYLSLYRRVYDDIMAHRRSHQSTNR